jgi:tetratricopeptide (TPR) repeat protein
MILGIIHYIKTILKKPAAAWALFALLAFFGWGYLRGCHFYLAPKFIDSGERLFYPMLPGHLDNLNMPLVPFLSAAGAYPVFSLHLGALVGWLTVFLCVAQVFSLSALILSPLHGFLSGLCAICLCRAQFCDMEQLVCSAAVLLLANVIVFNVGRKRTGDLLISAASAVLLFVKSVFLPFPVIYLFAVERRLRFKRFALLCSGAVMVVFLWGAANYADTRHFVFMDEGRGTVNMIGGSLGVVGTAMEGDSRALVGLKSGDSVVVWSVKNAIEHPVRYLFGVAGRLWLVVSFRPFLLILAVGGFWINRKRTAMRMLALLAGFFVAVHCIMTIEPRYFVPLWFLLLAPATGLLPLSLDVVEEGTLSGPAGIVFKTCGALLAVFAFLSMFLVLRYPFVAKSGTAFKSMAEANPGNAWLWEQYGRYLVNNGDNENGVRAFAVAWKLNPYDVGAYATALFVVGRYDDAAGLEMQKSLSGSADLQWSNMIVLMLMRLEHGKYDDAAGLLAAYEQRANYVRAPSGAYELDLQRKLREKSRAQTGRLVVGILEQVPYERVCVMGARFKFIGMDEHALLDGYYSRHFSDTGVIDAQAGRAEAAERNLLRAIELDPHNVAAYSTLGAVYLGQKRADKLMPLYKKAIESNIGVESSLLDLLRHDYEAYSAKAYHAP